MSVRLNSLLALADSALQDADRLDDLARALSFWPVFRPDVWIRFLEKAKQCGLAVDRKAVALCLDSVLRLSAGSESFLASIIDYLPSDLIIEISSLLSSRSRDTLIDALSGVCRELADDISLRFLVDQPDEDIPIESVAVQLPYRSQWVARLSQQPRRIIRTTLMDLERRCRDDVFWRAGIDQMLACADDQLLNSLYIWNITGVRQIVVERGLLRSPSQQVLATIGLIEDVEIIGSGARLFSKARRRSSEFIVRPERFAIELDAFLSVPAANQLELTRVVVSALIKYPNVQLRRQIIGALLLQVPSRCSLEALDAACLECLQSDEQRADPKVVSAIRLLKELVSRHIGRPSS